ISYTTTAPSDNSDNIINAGAGDDTINAGLGYIDQVDGGIGTDILVVDYSSLSVNVASYTNSSVYQTVDYSNRTYYSNIERFNLKSGSGDDTLVGGAGNDTINGGAGNDSLIGDAGDDIITQGAGADTVDGGTGVDTLVDADLSADTTGRVLNINGSAIAAITSGGNSYQGFEFFLNISGGSGNDNFSFTSSTPANNNINGGAGNDTINGGAGNDTINGGTGNDSLQGGTGNDTYIIDSVSDVISETSTVATEIDTVQTSISYLLGTNLENLTLTGTGAINGTGNSLNNAITGNSGTNTLNGEAGNDILIGGIGSDILNGGDGNDTLNGVGSENGTGFQDTLTGGNSNDLYILGNSSAVFYNDGNNTNAGLNDYARLRGFNTSQDKIQLQGLASSYLLGSSPINGISGTAIYLDTNGNAIFNSTDELIGIVEGVTGLNLTAGYFSYVA
ncbi:calcium-binding protein, partial [Nostoc sp.]|uniref:calcium-binding protein n=1 Tax=Nostoc sp. TaxID=1180 RepID=UPI002FF9F03F